jgi:endo-1,4-beta-mannosidase
LIWDLANEPRAYTDSTGSVLNPWINEMAAYVKSIDSNHVLSTGIEGWYGYASGVDFVQSQSSPYIDIVTFHDFPDYYGLSSDQALGWIRDRANSAQNTLKKPVYIGEFGKMVYRDAPDASTQMRTRNTLYKDIYSTAASVGVDGIGFWLLSGHQDDGTLYPDYDHFTVYSPEDGSTCRVIKSGSSLFVPSSGGKGGKPKSAQGTTTMAASSYETTRITQTILLLRGSVSAGKHWLELYNQTSLIPRDFDSDLYAQ